MASVKLDPMAPKRTVRASRASLAAVAMKAALLVPTSCHALVMESVLFWALREAVTVMMDFRERTAVSSPALLQMQFTTKLLHSAFVLWATFAVNGRV